MKITVEFEFPDSDDETNQHLADLILKIPGVETKIINSLRSGETTFDVIERSVLDHCMITKDKLHLKSRDGDIVDARRLCYYLSKELNLGSCRIIGERFGNKDHATAYNGWLKATHYLETDYEFKKRHKTFIESFLGHDKKQRKKAQAL